MEWHLPLRHNCDRVSLGGITSVKWPSVRKWCICSWGSQLSSSLSKGGTKALAEANSCIVFLLLSPFIENTHSVQWRVKWPERDTHWHLNLDFLFCLFVTLNFWEGDISVLAVSSIWLLPETRVSPGLCCCKSFLLCFEKMTFCIRMQYTCHSKAIPQLLEHKDSLSLPWLHAIIWKVKCLYETVC